MSHNITVNGGTSVRLKTAGKYCDRDIIITATGSGGSEDLNAVLTEQEAKIAELTEILDRKASGGGGDALFTGSYMNTLTEINDDTVTTIRQYGFAYATKLSSVRFSKLTGISPNVFRWCSGLVTADFPNLNGNIGISCFASCTNLAALILRGTTSVVSLSSTSAFTGTKIASGSGLIFVPSALVEKYKKSTNWSKYAAQFRAIEDYPEICGGE